MVVSYEVVSEYNVSSKIYETSIQPLPIRECVREVHAFRQLATCLKYSHLFRTGSNLIEYVNFLKTHFDCGGGSMSLVAHVVS